MYYTQETVKQIARDICRENKVCTCVEKDGHCVSIMSIAERLAKQGYKPPQKTPKKNESILENVECVENDMNNLR